MSGPFRYTARLACEIEERWQAEWERHRAFCAPNPGDPGFDGEQAKFYCLDMFPYPSGAGLHVGHPLGYIATDIVSRYKRMRGCNVLHPMGWDAFGLPAEQYAIETGIHPAQTTRTAVATFERQLRRFGFSYDWSRQVATIDEDYQRWTQWIFLRLYNAWFDPLAVGDHERGRARPIEELIAGLENGQFGVDASGDLVRAHEGVGSLGPLDGQEVGVRLWHQLTQDERRTFIDNQRMAYLDEQVVNWCPALGTALANEEVIDGRSERGGHPVHRKPLRQWMLRITAYAERLLHDLDLVDWPHSTKTQQTEWIGRSEGTEIDFSIVAVTETNGTAKAKTTGAAGAKTTGVGWDKTTGVAGVPPASAAPASVIPAQAGIQSASGPEAGGTPATPGYGLSLRVFTTRPDTIFGATYMVVAPEHALVDMVLADAAPETPTEQLRDYIAKARARSDIQRQESREKTGCFTGLYAVNPATGERIPIWTADYVLIGYGTGAIMAVPGQDQRDWEFAKAFGLPIVRTVQPPEDFQGEAYEGDGPAINSDFLDGLHIAEAKERIIEWLGEQGIGSQRVTYRLRDWLFSRQRYWGEPIPIVFDDNGNHHPVDPSSLPITLPPLGDYAPDQSDEPRPLLDKATAWVQTTAGDAGVSELDPLAVVRRETNTMPGWAGSCWYYLRFCDPHNDERFVGRDAEAYWMGGGSDEGTKRRSDEGSGSGGVDLYIGGAEHAVLHLLYARFWHKVLYDLGEVSTPEPFQKLFHQGLITGFAYQREDKSLVPTSEVDHLDGDRFVERTTGEPVTQTIAKMSKSLKNVVNPDDVIAEYGADTFRLYEMYMGPLDASKPWNTSDIIGMHRFLRGVWRLVVSEETGEIVARDEPDAKEARDLETQHAIAANERRLHRTIAKVEHDIEHLAFNTAIAALITFTNEAGRPGALTLSQIDRFVRILAPLAPHIAEEIWAKLGHEPFVAHAPWPAYDATLLVEDEIEMPVQIKGKVRAKITVPRTASDDDIRESALADDKVAAYLQGKAPRKVIVVHGRVVNIVP